MSDNTKAALERAIAEHIADETDGSIVTGWVLYVSDTSIELLDEQMTGYFAEQPDDQALHVTVGLLDLARIRYTRRFGEPQD